MKLTKETIWHFTCDFCKLWWSFASSDEFQLTSISEKGSYLVLAGKPLKEPVARYGPFVANSEGEIKQAMMDYQEGKMGSLA